MLTCNNRKCYHLLAAVAPLFTVVMVAIIRCADGFVGSRSSCYNINRLMARRYYAVSSITTESPMTLLSSTCLYVSYDDDSDEELFAALLIDQSSKAQQHNTTSYSPISGLDTSRYSHLANVTSPSPFIKPEEIIPLIMIALKNNDFPEKDAGIKLVWEFATDTTQYVFRNNRTGE
jgi:hypothetical protein